MAVGSTVGTRNGKTSEVIISADSHVIEPHDLWERRLPHALQGDAPRFQAPRVGEGFQHHPGGQDPVERVKEMAVDGVSGEVLYPTLGLRLFGMENAAVQEACFRVFNDWLMDYCRVHPDRLLGVACVSTYDIDQAVRELERCKRGGLSGALVWQAPHPDLPFQSDHYERFWSAAEGLGMPISLHILTGHNYSRNLLTPGVPVLERYRGHVNLKTLDAADALFHLIHSGVLRRHPALKLVIVENEIGWLPFYLQQWDYYFRRFRNADLLPIDEEPSHYFFRQVYATFFNDPAGCQMLSWWGQDNCMWSNDFPHANSTWPNSLEVIGRDLGHVPEPVRRKLVRENVVMLYNMRVPKSVGA